MSFHFVKFCEVLVDMNYQWASLRKVRNALILSIFYILKKVFLCLLYQQVESARQLILIWQILVELYNGLGCVCAKNENEKCNFTWNVFVFPHECQMYPDLSRVWSSCWTMMIQTELIFLMKYLYDSYRCIDVKPTYMTICIMAAISQK